MLLHDSHSEDFRCPLGAVPCEKWIRLRFYCNESQSVTLRIWDGSEHLYSMTEIAPTLFEYIFLLPSKPGLVWYDFIVHKIGGNVWYGNAKNGMGGIGRRSWDKTDSYQITVYDPAYTTPAFLREGILYQIFPDRFKIGKSGRNTKGRSVRAAHPEASFHENWNEAPGLVMIKEGEEDTSALDFFGGTLEGITEELDDLAELGITILYLNPIFQARTNHRYDTGSYEKIDPILGTNQDLEKLCSEAAKRGIRVLLDGVFSHTGADSLYFNKYGRYPSLGAAQDPGSDYYSWYSFEHWPDEYNSWWGYKNLPTVNKNNPDYRHYLLRKNGIIPRWIQRGAMGWRLDVADELPMDLIAQMRTAVKKAQPQAALLGEVWEDASAKVSYGQLRCYCLGDTLDSVMNYPLRRSVIDFFTGVGDAYDLRDLILHQQEVYPPPFLYSLMNLLGSHDRVRILNAMSGYDTVGMEQMDRCEAGKVCLNEVELAKAKERFLRALELLCALPGVPSLYYGDEVGMQGMADPWNRGTMDWSHPDRVLKEKIKKLFWERRASPVLQRGYLSVEVPDGNTLVIHRYAKNGRDVFGNLLDEQPKDFTINRRISFEKRVDENTIM